MNQSKPRLERVLQPSALHPSPGFNRRDLPAIDMAFATGDPRDGSPVSGTAEFAVQTPDVRCRIRGSLIFVPSGFPAGSVGDIVDRFWSVVPPGGSFFADTAIWLAKRDEATNGSADRVPVENLVGAYTAFRPIPDPGCLGFTFEAETANDEIWGRLTVDASLFVGWGGKWVLRVSAVAYQQMSEVEWNRVTSRFAARVLKTCRLSGGGGPV